MRFHSGFSQRPSRFINDLTLSTEILQPEIEDQYYTEVNSDVRRALRDRIVLGQMRAYDIQFANFQREIYSNSNLVGSGSDIIVLAANAVATVSGGEATKAALAAGSAFVVGAQGAISKDLFYQRAIPALLSQIEANRANTKTVIIVGLKQPDVDYSLAQAYVDLESLRTAAGIPSAISNVTQSAAYAAQSATFQLQQASIGRFSTTPSSISLKAWVKQSPANWERLTRWITSRFGANKVSTEFFLISSVYERDRQTAKTDLVK